MTIISGREATLNQDQNTPLHTARFRKTRLVITGMSGESGTIRFRLRSFGRTGEPFEASQVTVSFGMSAFGVTILGTTPEGVATLDIVYEIRTGVDV